MSTFEAKKAAVRDQQLKVQELVVRASDAHIYQDDSGDAQFTIGEPVEAVVAVLSFDDSGPTLAAQAASAVSITGTDNDVIEVASLALAANDWVILKYIVAE